MKILIIGGTRNVGHQLALELLNAGDDVTIFTRGITHDDLPPNVTRIKGDRSDPQQLAQAVRGQWFDGVVDTALFNQKDAKTTINILNGYIGHYIFLSTGQVYLVRKDLTRPYVEDEYDGDLIDQPEAGTYDFEEWRYGIEKRQAEDTLVEAWNNVGFPFTTLRLPMVNSERDHFHRIYGYLLRINDGGPILVPNQLQLPLRHVYGKDVVQAIIRLLYTHIGKGRAFNLSQDETISLEVFLALLADFAGRTLHIKKVDRGLLLAHNLLPQCSPFSDAWMSELDNRRSKTELGFAYTPLETYLQYIVSHYHQQMNNELAIPSGYLRRAEEIAL
jgi:nucleoside-diphosphate-sugar epimerase